MKLNLLVRLRHSGEIRQQQKHGQQQQQKVSIRPAGRSVNSKCRCVLISQQLCGPPTHKHMLAMTDGCCSLCCWACEAVNQ